MPGSFSNRSHGTCILVLGAAQARCVECLASRVYLESQWTITMGYLQSLMGYFGI